MSEEEKQNHFFFKVRRHGLLCVCPHPGFWCRRTLGLAGGNDLSSLQGLRRGPSPSPPPGGVDSLSCPPVPAPRNNSVGTARRPLPPGLQIKALIRSEDGNRGRRAARGAPGQAREAFLFPRSWDGATKQASLGSVWPISLGP